MDKLLFEHFLIFLAKSLKKRVPNFDRFLEYKWLGLLRKICKFQKFFFSVRWSYIGGQKCFLRWLNCSILCRDMTFLVCVPNSGLKSKWVNSPMKRYDPNSGVYTRLGHPVFFFLLLSVANKRSGMLSSNKKREFWD